VLFSAVASEEDFTRGRQCEDARKSAHHVFMELKRLVVMAARTASSARRDDDNDW
jgi:hypothetical protein